MNKFITCKITYKAVYIMVWDGFNIIDYRTFDKRFKQRIELLTDIKHGLTVYDIIYFDETNEFNSFLSGAIKINIHRKPFKNENYKNLKHQLYFYLIKFMKSNRIKIKCNIPKDQLLLEREQLKQYKYDTDDRLQILPRDQIIENIGHDINIVDTMSYIMFAVLKGLG